jgi:hypothetical protein
MNTVTSKYKDWELEKEEVSILGFQRYRSSRSGPCSQMYRAGRLG